jgi:hypothetical protein
VALGKFDALHVGHRALAEHAAELGPPFLVSFAGMAEVLGWEVRYGVSRHPILPSLSAFPLHVIQCPFFHNLCLRKEMSIS